MTPLAASITRAAMISITSRSLQDTHSERGCHYRIRMLKRSVLRTCIMHLLPMAS